MLQCSQSLEYFEFLQQYCETYPDPFESINISGYGNKFFNARV